MEGGVNGGSEKVKNGCGDNSRNSSNTGGSNGGGGGGDVNEALRKCLEQNNGNNDKCKRKIEALKGSSPKTSSKKPITPLRLRSGSLTDV